MKQDSWLLGGYRFATRAFEPVAPWFLHRRLARGKEDAQRLRERLGVASQARPSGMLVWMHGASVGEAASLLPLVAALRQRGCRVLMTTGTVTSARMLARRLPPGVIHQYVPLDSVRFVRRFLAHWRPDLLLIAESELWPNMICEAHGSGVPTVLINARISTRSAARWARAPGFIHAVLRHIDLFLAQSAADADRFVAFGAVHVRVAGNLKYDVPPSMIDHEELATLTALVGARPAWIAASTHEGEERIAAEVHVRLAERFPQLLTIVAPRHPDRGAELADLFHRWGLRVAVRTRGEMPTPDVQVYLVDTIGDLGTIYRLANIVFAGKSLAGHGGQNPIEPVNCGCVVLHGPNVQNFREPYELLDQANAALPIVDAEELYRALAQHLAEPSRTRMMARIAAKVVERQTGAVHRIVQALSPYLPAASPDSERQTRAKSRDVR